MHFIQVSFSQKYCHPVFFFVIIIIIGNLVGGLKITRFGPLTLLNVMLNLLALSASRLTAVSGFIDMLTRLRKT